MLFAIACSAGEAVLELTLPQVMSDIVDIGIANGDRGYRSRLRATAPR